VDLTIGKKIAGLRKEKGITQEELSELLDVSPQAVSKWENDLSCPDIMLLPKIANVFHVTVDELLSSSPKKETVMLPAEQRKSVDDLVFRILINSSDGDKVRVNLPLPLIKVGLEIGMRMPQVSKNESLKDINFEELFKIVEHGVRGKIIEIEGKDGDLVEVVVE